MARTESKVMQVHPNDEQQVINLMQRFHWSLLNAQEIKLRDSHLESSYTGDIKSVTVTEHYIKLSFSRDIDLPNLDKVKRLENQFFSLPQPYYPKLFPISIWLWIILAFFYGIGIIGWLIYFFVSYTPKKELADKVYKELMQKRTQILEEVDKL